MVKNSPASAGDTGSIPDLGKSHLLWSQLAPAPQLLSWCYRAQEPQLLKPTCPRACDPHQERTLQREDRAPQLGKEGKARTETKTKCIKYVCVCVCACVYMCDVCVCVYTCDIYMCVCMHVYICVMCVYICVMCVCIYV